MIQRGPFRPRGSASYLSFVHDIMDGYFPSEFKHSHPDGIFLELMDKSGQDYTVGCADATDGRMDKAQLLRRLPKTVIRKGQLIDLRAGIEDKLNDNHNTTNNAQPSTQKYTDNSHLWTVNESDSIENGVITNNVNTHNNNKAKYILLSTPASLLPSDDIESIDNKKDSSIVQIQIKWLDKSTFLAKMFELDTVLDLKRAILNNLTSTTLTTKLHPSISNVSDFELRNAYPPRILLDEMTLKEEGLVPNGTVHAKLLQLT